MAELGALFAGIGEAVGGEAAAGGAAAGGFGGGSILSLLGTGLSVVGSISQGQAAKQQAEFDAKQKERQAADEQAIATREAEDKRRQTAIVLSRQRAVAAASGAGTFNSTIFDLMEDTAQRGDYLERSTVTAGQERAAGLLDQAAADRYRGRAAYQGSILQGFASGFTGLSKLNSRSSFYG